MKQFIDKVTTAMPKLVLRTMEPMSAHTTFRIGGEADLFASPDEKELVQLLQFAKEEKLPVTVIGNGSNLLVSDRGIRGLTIEIGERISAVHVEGTCITAQAGSLLSQAAQEAAKAGLGGMEFAAGIPGSVGGAVTMNAGAYGGEMKDILKSVTVLTEDGQLRTLAADELELGYRHSCIPARRYIVVSAVFSLSPRPEDEIRSRMAELGRQRIEKQPLEYPSAGSTFKRPEGHFAGKLIMDAGLRGYTLGGAQVSEKHCGFVINKGGATAADVCRLIRHVQDKVKEVFEVELEPEVKLLGSFED